VAFELGIQSFCFRKFTTIPDLADALVAAGLGFVEIWPKHLPWETDPAQVDEAMALLSSKGITVNAYGNVRFGGRERATRSVFEFAKRTGLKALTVDLDPDEFEMIDALGAEYGIRLALHNHGRKHRWGRPEQIDWAFSHASSQIGFCLDTAWWLDAGENPLAAVDRYGDRIYGVHLKDFVLDAEGNHEDVIIGTGGLDLPAFLQRLKGAGFDGYMSIEYEGDVDDPLPAVIECVRVITEAIDAVG
jgi:inosose dehydratase